MKRPPQLVTTPAVKYGPTDIYGTCEVEDCTTTSRTTCPVCDGQFCRTHVAHQAHVRHIPPGDDG